MGVVLGKFIPKLRSPWDLPDETLRVSDGSRKVSDDKIVTADGEEIPDRKLRFNSKSGK
jgi:hypothetical protein